jgi:hypothetical protein
MVAAKLADLGACRTSCQLRASSKKRRRMRPGKLSGKLPHGGAQISPLGQVELQELPVCRRNLHPRHWHISALGWADVG